MTTTITNIPLNKLAEWEGNVRKTQVKGDIAELAASIKAHGLLQNLSVIKDGKGFAVIAGSRRLAALQQLAKDGEIKSTHPVPCRVYDSTDDAAAEISLAENVMRVNMHAADEFEAFAALLKEMPLADVAQRFGKTERYVQQRLKLSKVSKKVLKAFRDGELTLAQVEAFTVTEDHKKQNELLDGINPEYESADDIRHALREDGELLASDRRMLFVTVKAYEKAGGTFKPGDLFAETDERIVENPQLLEELVLAKLEATAEKVRKEGWKWVEARTDYGYDDRQNFMQLHEEFKPLPEKEQKKLDKLTAELAKARKEWDAFDDIEDMTEEQEEASEKAFEKHDALKEKLDEFNEQREEYWPDDKLAIAGAIVYLSFSDEGKMDIERGLVKPEDKPQAKAVVKRDTSEDGEEEETGNDTAPEPAGIPASLVEQLTAEKSAAITAELLNDHDVALRAIVYNLSSQAFYDGHSADTALQITLRDEKFKDVKGSKAVAVITEHRDAWLKKMPEDHGDLRSWIDDQPHSELLMLLAFCTAISLNAQLSKADALRHNPKARLKDAEHVAQSLKLDMTRWFTTTADNYFSKVSAAQIEQDVAEFSPGIAKHVAACKQKGLKAKEAEKYLTEEIEKGNSWLPRLLRPTA